MAQEVTGFNQELDRVPLGLEAMVKVFEAEPRVAGVSG